MSAFNVVPAHAGTWRVEAVCDLPYSQQEDEGAKRYQGETELSAEGYYYSYYPHYVGHDPKPTEVYPPYKGVLPYNDYRLDGGREGVLWHIGTGTEPEGGKGLVSVKGTIKMVIRYDPDPIRDSDGHIIKSVDPNDKPKGPVYIRVKVSPYVSAGDGYSPQIRDFSKEHVEFSAGPAGTALGGSQSISRKWQYSTVIDGSHTFFIKFNPDAGGEVDQQGSTRYTIPLVNINKAEAKLDGDRTTFHSGWDEDYQNEYNKGRVDVDIAVEGELTRYALSIGSDIEPSWRKLEGNLSDEYKKSVEVDGVLERQPDPNKAQLVSSADDSPQVWRVKCQANFGDPTSVESAAVWLDDTNHGALLNPDFYDAPARWYGSRGLYFARLSGFTNPQYKWSYSGGVPTGNSFIAKAGIDTENSLDLRYSIEYDSYLSTEGKHPEGLMLGTARHQLAATQTDVTLTVKETGEMPLDLTCNYAVNWHVPYEKQKDLPSTRGKRMMGKSVNVPYTGSIVIPAEEPQSINIAAGLEGVAGAVGAATGTGPAGYAVAASIAAGLAGLVDLKWEYGGQPGYGFTNDDVNWVKTQGSPEWVNENFSPPTSSAWTSEKNGYSNFDVVMKLTKRWTNLRWETDEYDGNGFVGPKRMLFAEKDYVLDYEPHYTLRPGKPVTPPTGGGNQ